MDYLNSAKQTIQNAVPNVAENAQQGLANIQNSLNAVKDNVASSLNQFASKPEVGQVASADYLSANGLIAKFAFLVLVLIVFLFLLNLGINLIGYFLFRQTDPIIVKGLLSGGSPQTISQNPADSGSIVVYRSNNEKHGIEFTWSAWLNVERLSDSGGNASKYQHIFNKGTADFDSTSGLAKTNNAPGLYLNAAKNDLKLVMDVVNPIDGAQIDPVKIDIENIPLKKWFHLAIRLENHVLDVYVNGLISSRTKLDYVPKQNYDSINLCNNGGFSGSISNLRYFSRSLSIFELNNIVYGGPNTTSVAFSSQQLLPTYDYLSSKWYKF